MQKNVKGRKKPNPHAKKQTSQRPYHAKQASMQTQNKDPFMQDSHTKLLQMRNKYFQLHHVNFNDKDMDSQTPMQDSHANLSHIKSSSKLMEK